MRSLTVDSDRAAKTLPNVRTLALAGIIAPLVFIPLVILQGFLIPEYSHVRLPISALAAWPTGWIQDLNFYILGALILAFGLALHRGVQPTRRGIVGVVLFAISGIGIIIAGLFPWKMIDGVPTETPLHVVGAVSAFAASGVGFVVFASRMREDPRWRGLAAYTRGTGIVLLLLFVALGFFAVDDGTPLHPWAGLIQRILAAVWFTCMIVLAVRLRALVPPR